MVERVTLSFYQGLHDNSAYVSLVKSRSTTTSQDSRRLVSGLGALRFMLQAVVASLVSPGAALTPTGKRYITSIALAWLSLSM